MRIQNHVRNNVVGYVALFFALSGGVAWATHPGGANTINSADIINGEVKEADVGQAAVATSELVNNQVKAADIGDGEVKTAEIANGQVKTADIGAGEVRGSNVLNDNLTGADVASNSLKGVDIDESTLSNIGGGGPAGGDLTGTYPNPQIAPDAVGTSEVADGSLTGSDVDESTLGQVPSALLGGLGESGGSGDTCNPAAEGFASCETVDITIPPGGARLLLIGRVNAFVESGGSRGVGTCRLDNVVGTQAFTSAPAVVEGTDSDVVTLLGVTSVQGPGPHSFGISCNELGATTIDYDEAAVDAVALSPG